MGTKSAQLAQWLEVVGSVAIISTLVVLVMEVRGNTAALERQVMMDRAVALNTPFFQDPRLAAASAKIRAVDGPNRVQKALSDRYQLTEDEALVWSRHLGLIFQGIRADFELLGDTPQLRSYVYGLLSSGDVALAWDEASGVNGSEAFTAFVESARLGRDAQQETEKRATQMAD
jgi:hypothetical protein